MISEAYCAVSQGVQTFATNLFDFSYTWLTLLYFIIGLFGNIVLLAAFYKQSKEDGAYWYQILLTVSKTLEVLSTSAFNLFHNVLSGGDVPGAPWFMKNYIGMFLSAHIFCTLSNWFMVSSLFFSVAMTADRVFALSKPFVYKNINHRRHQAVAGALCFFSSFLLNLYISWYWNVGPPKDPQAPNATYEMVVDGDYIMSPLGVFLDHLRTFFRVSAVLALVILNVIMAIIFRRRTGKVNQMTQGQGDPKKEQQRKNAERMLLILTIYQSILTLLATIPHSIHFIAIFTWEDYTRCYIAIWGPIADDLIMISDAADFFIIITINKRLRRMVLKVFPGQCGISETTTVIQNISVQTRGSVAAQ